MSNQTEADPIENLATSWCVRLDACGRSPTRTPATLAQYRKDVASILRASKSDPKAGPFDGLCHAVKWFAGENRRWSAATIRKYRASLLAEIASLGYNNERMEVAIQDLFNHAANANPVPRPRSEAPQTSAKKRKYFEIVEWNDLIAHLVNKKCITSALVAGAIGYGAILGNRPIEWLSARIVGNEIVFDCAKHTNGRGIAATRSIDISRLNNDQRQGLRRFLFAFARAAETAGNWQRFYERLAKALTRACAVIGIDAICPYTVRQQAVGTAKKFMHPREVAAYCGHVSAGTARKYYARASGGWSIDPIVRPTNAVVAKVKIQYRGRSPHRSEDATSRASFGSR